MGTVLHIQGHDPVAVERAFETIFAREERPRVLRLEGTYSAVLARAADANLTASYRYLVLRPHADSQWTPVLELGNRADGLDIELSRVLDGAPVFTTFVYGDGVSGYRLARHGALVDAYSSDPSFFAEEQGEEVEAAAPSADALEEQRGHPERFADLLPSGTTPEDFVRVVLLPGWWEARASGTDAAPARASAADADDIVDEADRMRCIGLALELWGPSEYPFFEDPEDLTSARIGPAITLAFA